MGNHNSGAGGMRSDGSGAALGEKHWREAYEARTRCNDYIHATVARLMLSGVIHKGCHVRVPLRVLLPGDYGVYCAHVNDGTTLLKRYADTYALPENRRSDLSIVADKEELVFTATN